MHVNLKTNFCVRLIFQHFPLGIFIYMRLKCLKEDEFCMIKAFSYERECVCPRAVRKVYYNIYICKCLFVSICAYLCKYGKTISNSQSKHLTSNFLLLLKKYLNAALSNPLEFGKILKKSHCSVLLKTLMIKKGSLSLKMFILRN